MTHLLLSFLLLTQGVDGRSQVLLLLDEVPLPLLDPVGCFFESWEETRVLGLPVLLRQVPLGLHQQTSDLIPGFLGFLKALQSQVRLLGLPLQGEHDDGGTQHQRHQAEGSGRWRRDPILVRDEPEHDSPAAGHEGRMDLRQ